MRVLFHTAADATIGMGHVRRCLSLAGALRDLGADCEFLLQGPEAVRDQVRGSGFGTYGGAETRVEALRDVRGIHPDAVVTDSYALDGAYWRAVKATGVKVVVLDDLANCEYPVDLVVNGTAGAERLAYRGAADTRYLLGPRYILLRPVFALAPERRIRDRVERVLVTTGGANYFNLTERMVAWTRDTMPGVGVDVVMGPLFQDMPLPDSVIVHRTPPDMRTLMLAADLALCAGGQTVYELAATGTPAIAVQVADNQVLSLTGLSGAGTLIWAGRAQDPDLEGRVRTILQSLANDPVQRGELSRRGRELVDGQGSARVAHAIVELDEKDTNR